MGYRRRERRRHPDRAGRLATTNAQGAANFPAELIGAFTGLNVAIVADRDLAGYQRAITLHDRLHATAAQVVLLTPAIDVDKGDVTDHVNAGLWDRSDPFGGFTVITAAELHTLAGAAKAAGPPTVAPPPCRKPAPPRPARPGARQCPQRGALADRSRRPATRSTPRPRRARTPQQPAPLPGDLQRRAHRRKASRAAQRRLPAQHWPPLSSPAARFKESA
ncbi:hypothetical protein L837_5180 [Mycobacterium avium MAV_061107_1842]|nr:hypothetical protein L837_5180 [Mycobacterium avium MAV_061107_1842]